MEPSPAERVKVDERWLATSSFAFRAGPQLKQHADAMRFEMNGRISGYHHRNEFAWQLAGGVLTVLRDDGVPTCIASAMENMNGTVSFVGRFLLSREEIIHRFEENRRVEGPPSVSSFDLFDTLIARRCYDPAAIFVLVEAKSRIDGFARLRQAEERKLWLEGGEYSLDDIYAALGAASGWPASVLARLRMLELAEEWENAIPVKETTARVLPGDVVVSDMYLPRSFLERMITERCGLAGCTLHVSSHGKHRGEIWDSIKTRYRIRQHHGDNPHSDVESARRAGLAAELVTLGGWNDGEKILRDAGLSGFAKAVREVRLGTFDRHPMSRAAQLAQLEVNLPFLIVAGHILLRQAAVQGADTLLLSSRDCNLWHPLLTWMAYGSANAPLIKYFKTSRILQLSGSPAYEAYFARMRGRRTILVDISGTGRSPSHFLGTIGAQTDTSIFLVVSTPSVSSFIEAMAPERDDVQVCKLNEQPFALRIALESLNMSLEGRAHRMAFNGHEFQMVEQGDEFRTVSRSLIATMRTVFLEAVTVLERTELRMAAPAEAPDAVLKTALESLIALLERYRRVWGPIATDMNDHEPSVRDSALAEQRFYDTRPPPGIAG